MYLTGFSNLNSANVKGGLEEGSTASGQEVNLGSCEIVWVGLIEVIGSDKIVTGQGKLQ